MIRYTSRISLLEEIPNLPASRARVYDTVYRWLGKVGPSIEDIADHLNMKESSVCGRVNELKKSGALEEGEIKKNSTGKKAMTYVACVYREPEDPRQTTLF